MIIDARRDAPLRPVDCDVCIIGAGAAGITLALQLGSPQRSVCVLEGGGLNFQPASQSLLEGEASPGYPPLHTTRLAALGGSTQVWSGWCRPLDAIDFVGRADFPHSGWPLSRDDLQPFYVQAHDVLQLGPDDYDAARWEQISGTRCLPLPVEQIATTLFRQSPIKFGSFYRPLLAKSPGVHVYLHANVMRLKFSGDARSVTSVEVATLGGHRFEVHARLTILAAGGIENARLLLLSATNNSCGPANTHGQVGRYFTDHGYVDSAVYVPAAPGASLRLYSQNSVQTTGAIRTARAALSVAARRQLRDSLLNCAMFFRPAYESHPAYEDPHVRALLQVWDMWQGRAVPDKMLSRIALATGAPYSVACAAWSRLRSAADTAAQWRMRTLFECAADPDNRVELSDSRDALGRPQVRLYWRMREGDLRSVARSHVILDEALHAAGLGRLRLRAEDPQEWLAAAEPGMHHTGTTRMHDDPSQGVVDRNCRVHGVDNLFISGSSVFPTAGFANPTLTVVALSLRLIAHLRQQTG
jgi:choline dehydrogenase-like flavoprotein